MPDIVALSGVLPTSSASGSGATTVYGGDSVAEYATVALLYGLPLVVGYQAYRKYGVGMAVGQAAGAFALAFAIGFSGAGSPVLTGIAGAWAAPDGYKMVGAAVGALAPFALARL